MSLVGRVKFPGCLLQYDVETEHQQQYGQTIAPNYVDVPGIPYRIPQYAPTVRGKAMPHRFDPANDCDGYFMGSKFKHNNNCYNYSCNIATNSFAQPGRKHGIIVNSYKKAYSSLEESGRDAVEGVTADGLVYVGKSIDDIKTHAKSGGKGHYVALLIALEDKTTTFKTLKIVTPPCCGYMGVKEYDDHFRGDLHFVRCDDAVNFSSWSHKCGDDAVNNFDCAGHKIVDPSKSNWTLNGMGSLVSDEEWDMTYQFYCFLFVPAGDEKVDII